MPCAHCTALTPHRSMPCDVTTNHIEWTGGLLETDPANDGWVLSKNHLCVDILERLFSSLASHLATSLVE